MNSAVDDGIAFTSEEFTLALNYLEHEENKVMVVDDVLYTI